MEDNFKFKGRRRILASELKKKGILNNQIINSIETIPRHLFIDPGLSEQAYIDKALPIDSNQTISQPYTVAFQTQLLNPLPGEKILEIGSGAGHFLKACENSGVNAIGYESNVDLVKIGKKQLKKWKQTLLNLLLFQLQ